MWRPGVKCGAKMYFDVNSHCIIIIIHLSQMLCSYNEIFNLNKSNIVLIEFHLKLMETIRRHNFICSNTNYLVLINLRNLRN